MVSVRCMRGWLPGGKSMTANRVPFAGGEVPMMRAPKSSISSPTEMSAGVRSVDQISVETVPGLGYLALVAGPCMSTLATLLAWPVTKRRMGGYCSGMIVIRLSSAGSQYSIEFCSDRLDECAPVRQIVLDELGKLRGREIDALEAVHAEELARLRQFPKPWRRRRESSPPDPGPYSPARTARTRPWSRNPARRLRRSWVNPGAERRASRPRPPEFSPSRSSRALRCC